MLELILSPRVYIPLVNQQFSAYIGMKLKERENISTRKSLTVETKG